MASLGNQKQGKKGKEKQQKKNRKEMKAKQSKRRSKKFNKKSKVCLSYECIDAAVSNMKLLNFISNYQKKYIRHQRKLSQCAGKSRKKGMFASDLARLVNAGGGDVSAPVCGDNSTNAGALAMRNLRKQLQGCESTIEQSCNPENLIIPSIDTDTCEENIASHLSFTEECMQKTGVEACSCWQGGNSSVTAAIKTCDLTPTSKATVDATKACVEVFSRCRKLEDGIAHIIHDCNQDPEVLKSKLRNL